MSIDYGRITIRTKTKINRNRLQKSVGQEAHPNTNNVDLIERMSAIGLMIYLVNI